MQIILQPVAAGGENFLLDVSPADDVAALRATCAARLGVTANKVKLVCEGLELADGATLADFYVTALSTVRLVVRADAPAAASTAAPSVGSPGAADDFNVVLDAEMPRAVVVTGIPDSDAATTERCIFDTFAAFGPIARIIFQHESSDRQHAVIIYHGEHSAASSLAADATQFMGAAVHVVLASSLLPPPAAAAAAAFGAGGTGVGAAAGGPRPTLASNVVADLLARGYLFGVQGVAHIKRLDTERGLSQRVSVVADNVKGQVSILDQHYRVSTTVLTTYEQARQQTMELDHRYGISQRVASAAHSVAATAHKVGGTVAAQAHSVAAQAHTVAARALDNPQVAAAVQGARDLYSRAGGLVGGLVDQARADIKNIEARVKSATAVPAATPAAMPPPPAAAAAAVDEGGLDEAPASEAKAAEAAMAAEANLA